MDFFNPDKSVPTSHDNRVENWGLDDEPESIDWKIIVEIILGVTVVGIVGLTALTKAV